MLVRPLSLLLALLLLCAFAACGTPQTSSEAAPPPSSEPEAPPSLSSDSLEASSEATPEAPPEQPPLRNIEMTAEEIAERMKPDSEGFISIAAPEDLAALSLLVNSAQQEVGAEPVRYRLTADINMKGIDFTPVGNPETGGFTGVFDGQGYVIRSLTIRGGFENGTGLFGAVGTGGTVREVHLIDADIQGRRSTGGIAGVCMGTLEGCSVRGKITAPHENVGGFVGLLEAGGKTVQCAANAETRGSARVGGFAGQILAGASIADCYSLGTVVLEPSGAVDSEFLGGFAGRSDTGGVKNCYTVTEVYANVHANVIGAFMGYNGGEILSCYYKQESASNWKEIGREGEGAKSGVKACTVEEITERNTFDGWDFQSVWGIADNKNRGLPFLNIISG